MTAAAQSLARPAPGAGAALEGRSLTKNFPVPRTRGRGSVHAVDDASLALPRGGITGLVGESGSGKSTLALMLGGVIKPTSGELLLDGQPVTAGRRDRRAYAREVQFVQQDPFSSLNPVHDVRYHLARPLKLHRMCPPGTSVEEAVLALLDRVALTPAEQFIEKYPHELSGGQRQRVAIARALAVEPRVLLADEPVSMLDVSIRLGVLNLLADLRERDGLTILYITHDIASARYLCDDITVMYAGRIVEAGPAVTVTDDPSHPYTQLLLSAAPNPDAIAPETGLPPDGARGAGRGGIPAGRARGGAPSLLAPPTGCRFHPRCPQAMEICSATVPPPAAVAPGHVSSCWLHAPARGQATQAKEEE